VAPCTYCSPGSSGSLGGWMSYNTTRENSPPASRALESLCEESKHSSCDQLSRGSSPDMQLSVHCLQLTFYRRTLCLLLSQLYRACLVCSRAATPSTGALVTRRWCVEIS
jgi:hypothetical protein